MNELHRNCPTESDTFRRVEVISGVAPRRRWSTEDYAPGASATAVVLRHGLHRNQIFGWRRQFRDLAAGQNGLPNFTTSGVGEAAGIELVSGGVTTRVGSGFDAGTLRRALLVVRELG
jgi:transposase